jgi:hypothetical protein
VTRRGRGTVLAVAMGVAACSVATPPSPTDAPTAPPSAVPSAQVMAPSTPPTTPEATRKPAGDLGREITMERLDPAWTHPLLEVASDGDAIVFSSGVADGADAPAAPDLWRYRPGAEAPELLWRNPARDHSLLRLAGEWGTWAFVDAPTDGELAWTLYLLTEGSAEPIVLDTHPGDPTVSGLAPSFFVHESQVAWTAFDIGPSGPVSQLRYARAPAWEPILLAERDARKAEFWMPTMRGTDLVYCEVVYAPDRASDQRHVYRMSVLHAEDPPVRIDASARATMPILLMNGGIIWKEAEPGFNMFNWGTMFRFDEATGEVSALATRPQEWVNFPSAGHRFVAWWGAADRAFGVYDLDLEATRLIDRWPAATNVHVLRPHISGNLLVWLHAIVAGPGSEDPPEVRFAVLPGPGTDRSP